jgi:hypothetical protein
MYRFQKNMNNFKTHLLYWNKNVFGNICQSKQSLEKGLEEIQKVFICHGYIDSLQAEEEMIKKKLEERYKKEKIP